jgi:hypothetical protein
VQVFFATCRPHADAPRLSLVLEVKKTWSAKQLKEFPQSTRDYRLTLLWRVLPMAGMTR